MTPIRTTAIATMVVLAGAATANAQQTTVQNPSFESFVVNTTNALGWREFFPTRRRVIGDGITPNVFARTGTASMEMVRGTPFSGFDTNELNLDDELNDMAYGYGCGPAVMRMWYYIPSAQPILIQPGGVKFEFRRSPGNTSVYLGFEDLFIRTVADGATGHTGDAWVEGEFVVWPARFDFIHLYNNMGNVYGQLPQLVSLLPFRFSDPFLAETGSIWVDDISFVQDTTGSEFSEYIIWDDQEVSLRALDQPGVVEPEIPVFFYGDSTVYDDGDQVGFGCLPSADEFTAINIIDRVPSTNNYPQTYVDIVANGYVRATYQNVDGTAGSLGSSVITAPSFRRVGQPLDLIPDMASADLDVTYNFPPYVDNGNGPEPDAPPARSDFTITGTGTYGAFASVTSLRDYSQDPAIGDTEFTFSVSFTANSPISLQQLGNDAFRLMTVSSMFADRGAGEYDASYIEVDGTGGLETVVLHSGTPRNAYLWPSPRSIAVGSSFRVVQDTDATFNENSPTIEVTLDSVSGAAGTLGVQGFLTNSTDPNDDSLSVWLEWVSAPGTIAASSVITATFTVSALPPSAPPVVPGGCDGDVNGDGFTNAADFVILSGNFGAAVPPNTGGDLNGDGLVNAADFVILAGDFGCAP